MSSDAVDPLRLLQEDLKDDDYTTIVQACRKIGTVALALGPARARAELLPFLQDFSDVDNDEALAIMARELGDLTDLIGGPTYAATLMPLLEKLAGEEEALVREAATDSLNKICVRLPRPEVVGKFVPLVKRLANGDWFTTRVSASALFPSCYPLVAEQVQTELRTLFTTLCNDDTPMVRKAAYLHLGSYAAVLQKQYWKTDIYPILKQLAQDDIDNMRVHAIECCVSLAKKIDGAEFVANVLPVVEGLQDDTSWRVRLQLVKYMPQLCESAQEPISSKRLLPLFAKLLKDREGEVRSSACRTLSHVAPFCKNGLVEFVAPLLDSLAVDFNVNVRVEFAQSVCNICPHFPREAAGKLLVPILQQMSKDENYEVRNYVIGNLDTLGEALGASGLQASVLPALLDLSKDPKWRVRMAVVDKCSVLGKHLGVKVFEKKMQQVLLSSLSDHVFAIREKACEQIGSLVRQFGGKWAAEKFYPSAFAIYDKQTNYLHRMTCLLIIKHVAPHSGADVVEKSLLPLCLAAATDEVPNVRLAGARAFADIIPYLDKALSAAKVKPVLQTLTQDPDADVQYYATVALHVAAQEGM